jgi:iron complex transport system permease protein
MSLNDPKVAYTQFVARKMVFLVFCLALLILLILISASLGGTTKGPYEVLQAVAARFLPVESDPFVMGVVWHLRLPRVFLGIAAGIGLAISGAAMQGVTRNPLVSPFTVGISSAAAFGASMAIMFGVGYAGFGTYIIILSAFAGALGCAMLVFGLTRLKRASPETLVLAGIALTYFFGSLTAILQFFANEQQLNAMVNWTFGTLSGADWDKIGEDHRFLLPASCLVGAILVVGADIVGRTVMDPIILPIGIVISFVGVPMFLYLMMTRDTHWA